MSENIQSIYAPSLYWFAYQYHEGLVVSAKNNTENSSSGNESSDSHNEPATDEPVGAKHSGNESSDSHNESPSRMLRPDAQVNPKFNPKWVKNEYDKILNAFNIIKLDFSIREDRPSRQFDLLEKGDAETGRRYEYFTTNGEENHKNLEGFIYPQCIHDSYALNLNIFCPENPGNDEYAVTDLGNFNPENCFNPPSAPAAEYMGQTLFLSAYLKQSPPENIHDLEYLAKECWLSFFQLENTDTAKFPPLYRAAKWFGGYVYEYGDPRDNLRENPYGHLLIWFLFDESPTKILQKCYWELPELLLYYHKVSKTFQDSRVFYAKVDKIVKDNETDLSKFSQSYLSQERETNLSEHELKNLKNTLKKLLKTSLTYSQQLRNLEYAQNTIAINARNYQAILAYMAELADTPLEIFQIFAEKESVIFQSQISADLNYFKQGYILLDTVISSIRGLVEVDQAERDRILQDQNQKLQDHIQAIGVGIAAGAIVASSSGLMLAEEIAEITFPWQANHGKDLHPFAIAVLLSSAFALGLWLVVFLWLKCRRNAAKNKK